MKNVTYLLGAGASRSALPLVAEIPTRLKQFRDYIDFERANNTAAYVTMFALDLPLDQKGVEEQFLKQVEFVLGKLANNYTVDEYAKQLYEKETWDEYRMLKAILVTFFIYEQWTETDPRYEQFISSVSIGQKKFPENLNILSWNYDFQFEKAYKNFTNTDLLEERLEDVIDFIPLYKLNGTAGFIDQDTKRRFFHNYQSQSQYKMKYLLSIYCTIIAGNYVTSLLSFSWEAPTNLETEDILQSAEDSIAYSEALVVIGYSFPYFNMEVDCRMFKAMNQLKKIYIQDGNFQAVKESLYHILPKRNNVDISHISDLSKFYLAKELKRQTQ